MAVSSPQNPSRDKKASAGHRAHLPEQKSTVENVKDTLESIVVAFVLAFIFRAFIVEAFVIPTGSMAVTLYGEQLTQTCSTCGYEYAVGITAEEAGKALRIGANPSSQCPNCNMERDHFKPSQVARPDSGDRILVHKWPLDIPGNLFGPRRWDVTVFKDPRDGKTNFIKRLVGLPGEVLEIIDGDIYGAPIDSLPQDLVDQFEQLRHDVYEYGQKANSSSHPFDEFADRYEALNRQLLGYLRIQRKLEQSPRAQQSLWHNVYNHDFRPNDSSIREDQFVGWKPVDIIGSQVWDTSLSEISFHGQQRDDFAYIRFTGKPVTDFSAYNHDNIRLQAGEQLQYVGDLRLRFSWLPRTGNGAISLEMNRHQDKFFATIGIDGNIMLEGLRLDDSAALRRQPIDTVSLEPFTPGRAIEVEFMTLDYQVLLLINGDVVLQSKNEQYQPLQTRPNWFGPRPADIEQFCARSLPAEAGGAGKRVRPSEIAIGVRGLDGELRHVVLERDVFYRSQPHREPEATVVDKNGQPTGNHIRNPFYNWAGWGTSGRPILLRPVGEWRGKRHQGEYFMLGDNSMASKDSRLWWEVGGHLRKRGEEYQIGTVPGDQLIGKAFFVYWPSGYRHGWTGNVGLIPNFGRMRWIR